MNDAKLMVVQELVKLGILYCSSSHPSTPKLTAHEPITEMSINTQPKEPCEISAQPNVTLQLGMTTGDFEVSSEDPEERWEVVSSTVTEDDWDVVSEVGG